MFGALCSKALSSALQARRWIVSSISAAPSSSTSRRCRGLGQTCARGAQARMVADGQVWSGAGLSQDELMHKDECILVDPSDRIVGHGSKYASHRFEGDQPFGRLHRAFSVFLFDKNDRLLLQQRASTKITFPSVWTNTCCSHPLHGYSPSEVDTDEDIAAGTVPGAKRAAVRKLHHELGIDPAQLPLSSFKYLTRLHYCANDVESHGAESSWGEHEIDYILLVQAQVDLAPNADEVDDVRYVTPAELEAMMRPESGLRWSPWFRIIAERFLPQWWADLPGALGSDRHVDASTIHRIMVPEQVLRQ